MGYPGFRSTVDMDRIHVLGQGARGDTVRWIQRRLVGVAADGVFGPKTAEAVRAFQSSRRVAADGIVGLDTMQLLAWVKL